MMRLKFWEKPEVASTDTAPQPVAPRAVDPLITAVADAGALDVARSKGWYILKHRDTGALVRGLPQNSTGRIKFVDEPREPEEFVPGDWIVKPFGTGPRRVLAQATFAEQWEVAGEPTGEG